MPSVKSIFIYPIKSMGGIELHHSEVLDKGLQYDRMLMLVNKEGKFLTQRELAVLTQFECSLEGQNILLKHETDSITISEESPSFGLKKVEVWSSNFQAELMDPRISKWISERVESECHLVRMPKSSPRTKMFTKPPFKTKLSFADGYPVLLLSERSFDHLNSQMNQKININRFRANIVLSHCEEAHEEDTWNIFEIGSTRFKNIKPCARCQIVNINQETGGKSVDTLKTMSKYRKHDNNVFFGTNAIVLKKGHINIGDELHIID